MRRIALLLILCTSLVSAAHADDISKRAKVRELFTLLHIDQTSQQIMDSVMKQTATMPQQLFGVEMPPDIKPKFEAFQKQVFDLVSSQVGWKAMEPDYIELYAQTYSEEELDAIIAFYKTPAGASMIAKTPQLTTKGMEMVQTRMATIQPQMRKLIEDFVRDAKSTSTEKPASSSAKP